ncbi:MAG: hypothetical protein LUC93_12600 [Planctomycetaceae bacterium]|nr:hypothetical protein [Planctomycetaceae bacterium]
MASKMEIINLALANLSREPIQSLSEPNPEAFQLRVHWETALASVLRDHPWGFAMRRKPLAPFQESPIGFAYAYGYPGDCIQARRVLPCRGGSARNGPAYPFEIGRSLDGRHRAILTDLPDAALEYTTIQVPCEEFDPQFVGALAWRLAAEISLAVHADPQSHAAAISTYSMQLQQAKALDMRESSSPRLPDGDFLRSRY